MNAQITNTVHAIYNHFYTNIWSSFELFMFYHDCNDNSSSNMCCQDENIWVQREKNTGRLAENPLDMGSQWWVVLEAWPTAKKTLLIPQDC